MSNVLASQLDNIDMDTLGAIVTAALAVSFADGEPSEGELEEMGECVMQLTDNHFDHDEIADQIAAAAEVLAEQGFDGAVEAVSSIEDETMREVAFLIASAVAWSSKGVNAKEGVALQKISKALGIKEKRYFELLGQGKTLVG